MQTLSTNTAELRQSLRIKANYSTLQRAATTILLQRMANLQRWIEEDLHSVASKILPLTVPALHPEAVSTKDLVLTGGQVTRMYPWDIVMVCIITTFSYYNFKM